MTKRALVIAFIVCLGISFLCGCDSESLLIGVSVNLIDSQTNQRINTWGNIRLTGGSVQPLSTTGSGHYYWSLTEGTYTLSMTMEGYEASTQSFNVSKDENNISLRLKRKTFIEGEFQLSPAMGYGSFAIFNIPFVDKDLFVNKSDADFTVAFASYGITYIPCNGAGWIMLPGEPGLLPTTGYQEIESLGRLTTAWYAWKTKDGKYAVVKYESASEVWFNYKIRWDGGPDMREQS